MKSRSAFQWLGKTKPSLCKPDPPLFCSPQLNSPLPFTALGKTSGIYPARLQKRRYFLYLHCTSTNGCQILCILGNSNSTDPILWMALKDGAHWYPMEQSPHGGAHGSTVGSRQLLGKSMAQPTLVCMMGRDSATASAVAAHEVGAASTTAGAEHPLHPFLPSKWLWETSHQWSFKKILQPGDVM